MNTKRMSCLVGLTVALATAWSMPVSAGERFGLISAVPDDVFLCIAGQKDPERKFLDDYWCEVTDALVKSGIGGDVMALLGAQLGEDDRAQVDRLKKLATELLEGVDWDALSGGQIVFAERMSVSIKAGDGLHVLPNLLVLLQGTSGSASKNYEGLVGILDRAVTEINQAAGEEKVKLTRGERTGAKITSIPFFKAGEDGSSFGVSLALRGDVIAISLGDRILDESLGLLAKSGTAKPLSESPRFKQAFKNLPAAEGALSFFDAQALLASIRGIAQMAIAQIGSESQDDVQNAYFNEDANKVAAEGVEAYGDKDFPKALERTQKAYEIAPKDSRIMYNLACFHALNSNKDEALKWLDKAVEAGFHAPKKIGDDHDLDTLRSDPRFKATLAKAEARSKKSNEKEKVQMLLDRILDVPGMFDHVAMVEYTEGYTVHSDTIVTLVGGASEKPFYNVFGKREPLGEFEKFLPKETVSFSMDAGVDLIEVYGFIKDTIRSLGKEGEEILAKWAGLQEQMGVSVEKDVLGWFDGQIISITLKEPMGSANVLMLKVTDEAAAGEKLTAGLDFLSTSLQQAAQKNPMLGMLALRSSPCTHEKLPGFQNVQVGMSPQPWVCGTTGGYLVFASSANAAALCLATAAGEHPNIRKNSRVMAEAAIPKGKFHSISFTDKSNLGTELAQGIGMASMIGGMASMAIPDPKAQQMLTKILGIVSKLGPVVQKIDFYKSSAQYMTFDGQSWHTHAVTNYRSPSERPSAIAPAGTN